MLGALVVTVTVNEHELVLPVASVAVQFTVVAPAAKVEPDAGTQLELTPGQLSVTVGANVTVATQLPGEAVVMLAGQVMLGGWTSLTVTVKVQALVLPLVSVAVQVTVVIPFGKAKPLVGRQATVAPGQLSVAEGAAKLTTAVHWFRSVPVTTLAGQPPMTGFSVSFTVTVNVQAFVLPAPSVAVQVTVVVPLMKVEPLAGLQATVAPQ